MSGSASLHEFSCDGQKWMVSRHALGGSRQTGLVFHRGGETRFLAFTRGALPSDSELGSMCEEVLCALLQRAVMQQGSVS